VPGANGGAGATVGEVVTVRGDTLYVRDASGNTVKVKAAKGATVMRTVESKPREIRPGEQVVVQGTSRNGTVTASSIAAGSSSSSSSSSGGGAVDQLFNDDTNGTR
jgi:multidrug efflux pump subunit AcrA (membrane-fusion protein)